MLQSFSGNVFHVLYVYLIIWTFAVPTKSDDAKENTAIVAFRDVTISSWSSDDKTAKFKDVIAAVANDYCSSNYDNCALRFWNTTRTFRNSDVTIASNYPKQVETDIEIQFYVVLPSGNDIRKPNSTVLPKGTLDGILEANSTQIGAAVNAQVKNTADGSTTKPKTDNAMDSIMIPVGFGLLIFVIILACCLHYCHKKKLEQIKKEERRQFLLKQKSEGSKP
ncbi:uncharacterized protein LOC116300707 [Actinia tenebrosa]|uniref:Uncharacterized protein LOC116300707 n=1 Tax=Actinia tenebrosa TaxID=6105 RepID=A0A6P8IFM0_ACTTE|nr:uncharacterized protein LOC116300707 [Actinia tenebrosa]